MKHTLLFIVLACALVSYAQVPTINATPKNYEWILNIYHDIPSDKYKMFVYSSNEFDDVYPSIVLGHGLEESIASLKNLLAASKNIDTEFELQGYYFVVDKKYLRIRNLGELEYTAGLFTITPYALNRYIEELEKRYSQEKQYEIKL